MRQFLTVFLTLLCILTFLVSPAFSSSEKSRVKLKVSGGTSSTRVEYRVESKGGNSFQSSRSVQVAVPQAGYGVRVGSVPRSSSVGSMKLIPINQNDLVTINDQLYLQVQQVDIQSIPFDGISLASQRPVKVSSVTSRGPGASITVGAIPSNGSINVRSKSSKRSTTTSIKVRKPSRIGALFCPTCP